jgi:hypothetical protein
MTTSGKVFRSTNRTFNTPLYWTSTGAPAGRLAMSSARPRLAEPDERIQRQAAYRQFVGCDNGLVWNAVPISSQISIDARAVSRSRA